LAKDLLEAHNKLYWFGEGFVAKRLKEPNAEKVVTNQN